MERLFLGETTKRTTITWLCCTTGKSHRRCVNTREDVSHVTEIHSLDLLYWLLFDRLQRCRDIHVFASNHTDTSPYFYIDMYWCHIITNTWHKPRLTLRRGCQNFGLGTPLCLLQWWPWTHRGWHVGKSWGVRGNLTKLKGIERCVACHCVPHHQTKSRGFRPRRDLSFRDCTARPFLEIQWLTDGSLILPYTTNM